MPQDDAADQPAGDAFVPHPEELRRVAEEVAAQFPPPRLGTELVLLDVDPRRAHAYWNVDVDDFAAARALAAPGERPLVLRMQDVTGDTQGASFDVEVQGLQNHWQVDLWQPGRAYVAEIGLRQPDGALISLARSNRVETPRATQSPDYDTAALDVGNLDLGPTATDLTAAARATPDPAAETLADVPLIRDRYPEVVSFPAPANAIPPPERSAAPSAPQSWPSAEELVRHLPEAQSRVEAYYQAQEIPVAPVAGVPEPVPATPSPPVAAPPLPHTPAPTPASTPSPASLDQYVNLSSFVNGRTEVDLEVNVELHIYGRAKPGSKLTFYGQPVAVRPDGTFSIRKPLPQGAVVLPLVLHSDPPGDVGQSG